MYVGVEYGKARMTAWTLPDITLFLSLKGLHTYLFSSFHKQFQSVLGYNTMQNIYYTQPAQIPNITAAPLFQELLQLSKENSGDLLACGDLNQPLVGV